jgi:hypothetical protein
MKMLRTTLFALLFASATISASPVPPSIVSKLVALAGSKSQDCGAIPLDVEAESALVCAKTAIQTHTVFRVAVEYWGIDSIVWAGVAIDRRGRLWILNYDSYGSSPNMTITPCREIYFEPLPKGAIRARDFPRCKVNSAEQTAH